VNVGSLLTANAVRFPQKDALVEGDRRVHYRELNLRVNRLANKLLGLNFRKGDKACLYLKTSIEFAEIYFALSKLGVLVVPINFRLKGKELLYIASHSDSTLLFFDDTTRQNVESLRIDLDRVEKYVFVGDVPSDWYSLYEELLDESTQEPSALVSEDDTHSICYTSGTTGLPKGAVLTNMNIINGHYYVTSAEFGVSHDDIFLATTPLTQRIGWGKLINSIALGCTLVLIRGFNAEEAMKIVEKEKVTILSIVPTVGRLILQLPALESYSTRSLRMFFVTGEAFPVELKMSLMEKFPHVKIVSYFASTEAAIVTNMMHEEILAKPDSVGHLIPGVEVKILDDQGKEVPLGGTGEIVTRCGKPGMFSLMKEYYKDPVQTAEAFVDGWLRTGDMGRFDEQRFLYVVDRRKDMIISGGFNIYSREVEVILEGYEKVDEAAVIGVPDARYGEAVKAFVVLKQGASATEEEIIQYCKAHLASYKKPSYVKFVDSLPRNTVGKVMKYKLRETC
jgi:long-chain acyl-CoA synthetase